MDSQPMTKATIYHNPRCSKSRQALALLEEAGCDITVVEYLKTPPSASLLSDLLAALGIEANTLIRAKDAEFKALGLDAKTLDEKATIALLAETPKLIERPIVVVGKKAVVARPPERVSELLS